MSQDVDFLLKIGYLHIKNLISDPDQMIIPPPPEEKSKAIHFNSDETIKSIENLENTKSIVLFNYPQYSILVRPIKNEIETIIGEEIFPTYIANRYYFSGDEMIKCDGKPTEEINVTIPINSLYSQTSKTWVKTRLGDEILINLEPGDALIRLGQATQSWKEPVKKNKNLFMRHKEAYNHVLYLNYVRADGHNVHYAGRC